MVNHFKIQTKCYTICMYTANLICNTTFVSCTTIKETHFIKGDRKCTI